MYLTSGQLFPFFFGAALLLFSIILFRMERVRVSLWFLFLGALTIGFGMARLDPFLCLWDEQYHALVAKNLLQHPFKPMLYSDPLYGYDISNWTSNHVWLHKPPLFLWQIAVSLKLFGLNALAVRMPSVLLHALTALLVFQLGKRTLNAKAGFYGALFFACAYYPLELMAGKYATDHNDTAFLFYVTASIAAWMEYEYTGKRRWWILTGLMAGCAVLVKWLAGLLVYGCWFVSLGAEDRKKWQSITEYRGMLSALAVTIAITLPWYIYSFSMFPEEAKTAFNAHARHLVTPVEGHGGDLLFHLRSLSTLYGGGVLIPFLVVGGFAFLIYRTGNKKFRFGLLTAVVGVYAVYTIAATKMVSFGTVVAPLFYLGLGALAETTLSKIETRISRPDLSYMICVVLLLGTCIMLWKPEKVERYHSFRHPEDNFQREKDLRQMAFIERLKNVTGGSTVALFNADIRLEGHIACMFYADCVAYGSLPTEKELKKAKDYYGAVVVIDDGKLPDRIRKDTELLLMKTE